MGTSKHQRTVAALRHRARETDAEASKLAKDVIRDHGQSRELLENAIRAVAEADEAAHALNLAEAEMPKKLRLENGE